MRGSMMTMAVVLALGAVAPAMTAQERQQTSAARQEQVDPRAVVAEVRRIVAERYVLPERRPALDAVLAEGLSSGRYGVTDPVVLAERINSDLERVGRDRHLNIRYDPRQAEIVAAGDNQAAPDTSAFERQVRARNHGIAELKVLPGNVRYMDHRVNDWIGSESQAALNTALQFLSGGEAVIIDLRRNGGGNSQASNHIISHFLAAGTPLVTFHMSGSATPETVTTRNDLQLPRMIGKPLYVLVSNASASAAEGFAGQVAGHRVGEVVGETTSGAGFRNALEAIDGGFILSVSVGRAVLASTGKDWEAVGIAPTIPTPVPAALDVAHAHALRRIAGTASGQERARLEAMADALAARHERRATALPLAAYAGSYGERTIVVEGERLIYQRGTRPREILIPVGGNRFVLESDPSTAVEFAPSGAQVTTMLLGPVGGPMQGRFDRTGDKVRPAQAERKRVIASAPALPPSSGGAQSPRRNPPS